MNANCDGSGPHIINGEVRVLPTGGESNLILCKLCYRHEIAFRHNRNRELSRELSPKAFATPPWRTLKIYAPCNKERTCPKCNVERCETIAGNAFRCLNCGCEWNNSACVAVY